MAGRIITLIGADGSGKTTLARRLCSRVDVPAKYVYMGSNPAGATHALPPIRAWQALKRALGREANHLGAPDPGSMRRRPGNPVARVLAHLKSLAVLVARASGDAYRLCVVEVYRRRGYLVVLDRHPYPDYYAHRVAGTRGWRRIGDWIHGFLLERAYPRPTGPVFLDAPPEVLYERKPEGSAAALVARCREYHDVANLLPGVTVVNAAREEEEVLADLLRILDVGGAGSSAAGGAANEAEERVGGPTAETRPIRSDPAAG